MKEIMKKTVLVMLNEIRATLRRKSFTILALGMPLVLGIVALIVIALNRDASLASTETGDVPEPVMEGYVDQGDLIEVLPTDVPPNFMVTRYGDGISGINRLLSPQVSVRSHS